MIQRHYNRASRETAQERRACPHLTLRRFHNALKAALLRRSTRHLAYIDSVLDVAAGVVMC